MKNGEIMFVTAIGKVTGETFQNNTMVDAINVSQRFIDCRDYLTGEWFVLDKLMMRIIISTEEINIKVE